MPELTDNFAGELLANRLNLDPYIGYGYENYAKVSCYRHYVVPSHDNPMHVFQDSEGKWVMYFSAVTSDGLTRLFKCFVTLDDTSKTEYINEPIHPSFLNQDEIVHSVHGLGTYYVVLRITDATEDQNTTRVVLVRTRSSNPMDWTDYIDVTSHAVDSSAFGYDHKSKNILHVYTDNDGKEVWFSILNPTAGAQAMTPRKLMDTSTDLDYTDEENIFEYQGNPGQFLVSHMWVTYDRINEELLVGGRIKTEFLDTVMGGLKNVYHNLILNHSMSENTMAIGQGTLTNNIPYGQGTNYKVLEEGMGIVYDTNDPTCVTYGFSEYYQGTMHQVIDVDHSESRVSFFAINESMSGQEPPPSGDEYWFSPDADELPSGFSGAPTKGVYSIGTMLAAVGRPMQGSLKSISAKVARIEQPGNRIRLVSNHLTHDSITGVGNTFYRGGAMSVICTGLEAFTYSYGTSGNTWNVYEEGGIVKESVSGLGLIPEIPSEYTSYYAWTWNGDIGDPTFYFLVTKNAWGGSPDQNQAIVISYNDGIWTEYTTKLDPEGVAESKASLSSQYPVVPQLIGTFSGSVGMYTENDHVVFATMWNTLGPDETTDPTISVFDPATDSLVSSFRVKPGYGTQGMGWHEDMGYYVVDEILPTGVTLKAQGAATYADYWDGTLSSTFFLPLDYANDTWVTFGEMPVLLGGRFSIYNPTTVEVPLNQTSYVYLERDTEAPYGLHGYVTDGFLPNTFRRILLAKIESDDIGPISQTTYQVNWRT